ncbi:conserved phage C-terminal domain-containing protein [Schauerella aestuarii]|uniref:conserved phage C-terminal domain-containing protein n=1 Tax=Schauerella aestuarii TaxID=2511204 RepID=UPI00136AC921|nr:conserved phage C-terminal domain-containing protein [Achromobacter aestuarii]MYZ41401.1 hypothetical protein [Achromobacter aestuarii]
MAGDWIKFEVNTPEKQEVLAITFAMGWEDPDLTVGKLLRVWRWFDQQTVDGNAPSVSAALLDRIAGVSGFAQAMANVGWLVVSEAGVSLPNFDRHNGKTAKDRALTAKRVASHKANAKGNGKGNGSSVTSALPKEEKRREEDKEKTLSGKPDLSGQKSEEPEDVKASNADAREVISYLNNRTGCQYRAVEANLRLVRARLSEGYSLDDVKAVIDAKAAQWGDDAEMSKYLRPETLFGASKFSGYVGQVERRAPGAGWWLNAGFATPFEAQNAGCSEKTSYLWKDGHRMGVTA